MVYPHCDLILFIKKIYAESPKTGTPDIFDNPPIGAKVA